ncbi:hypothetical protein MASR2M8_09870 [Opitutaceae bacterium]
MFLIDLTHTSHTRARTGIQKVSRALYQALEATNGATPICHDPYRGGWRALKSWEHANLSGETPSAKGRGARWPLHARVSGQVTRWLGAMLPPLPAAQGLVVPEIFSPRVAASLPALLSAVRGPRVALFHDAIALKLPELSPPGTVSRFPSYLQELLAFDGIAAVSEDSRDALLDYWAWLGTKAAPPVQAIPLGIDDDAHIEAPAPCAGSEQLVVLSVGTLEARKNHVALLQACESLWRAGHRFELHLIGMAQALTGRSAVQRIRELQSAGYPIRYDGPVSDTALREAYRRATFTVYPSLMEGFGLPVLESLRHGRPCICSNQGALGESARGGGCLAIDQVDASGLAIAIGRLLESPPLRSELATAAHNRPLKSWARYADDLTNWMKTLPANQ